MINDITSHKGLFISHAHADSALVSALITLINDLFANHFDIFATSIIPFKGGDEWRKEIQSKLHLSRVVLVVITPQSFKREWIFFEAGAAWLETATRNKRLIPCRYNYPDFSEPLSEIHGVDLSSSESIRTSLIPALTEVSEGLRPADKFLELALEEFDQNTRHLPPVIHTQVQTILPEVRKMLDLIQAFFRDDIQSAKRFVTMLNQHNIFIDDSLLKEFMMSLEIRD